LHLGELPATEELAIALSAGFSVHQARRKAKAMSEQTKEPCPFDDGQGLHGTTVKGNGGRMAPSDVWWVQCKCGAEGPNARDADEAVANWNRRAERPGWREAIEAAAKVADDWCEKNHWPNGVWRIAAGIRALQPSVADPDAPKQEQT
jgi:hypothetical protein